jgi:hypothetical protein
MRGIATGDNDFFLFTNERRKELNLDKRWFVRVVGRTRDCPSSILDGQVLENLDAELLWHALNHPATLEHLRFVGKSYGDGAIKVEPRSLEDLIIPNRVLGEFDIELPDVHKQLALLEKAKSASRRSGFRQKAAIQKFAALCRAAATDEKRG